jgi:colanic acid/amylovoran biosynthesis glycosyltransferase
MLTMIHQNRASFKDGVFRVDRKFHVGMAEYARSIKAQVVTVHPEADEGEDAMDMVDIPQAELNYGVMTLKTDTAFRLFPDEAKRLKDQIARSTILYGGAFGGASMARSLNIPYVPILELDLPTRISVSTAGLGLIKKLKRAARIIWDHETRVLPDIRGAIGNHCNGYPVYEESKRYSPACLLYLDSRMSSDLVIAEDALEERLKKREGQPLRLLYSGRYEHIKGVADAVRVGLACIKLGLDFEMHFYGKGSLRPEMDRLVSRASAGDRIFIHDPVTYPELVEISRGFDLFVCCHVQSDPSCTYLESLGAGLPIVGYANRMWKNLCLTSEAGFSSPMRRPGRVAADVLRLASDRTLLGTMSRRARRFAIDHVFEKEFSLRIRDLNMKYATAEEMITAKKQR